MKYAITFIICIILFSCNEKTSKNILESQIDELLKQEFKPDEPGGSVLVKKGNNIAFLKSYGLADLKTGEKITENTVFNTGSISKTFVANGILILEERDSLSLNDSIYKYFKDFKNPEIAKKVKIKHMLSHTSGLIDNRRAFEEENWDFFLTAKDKENFEPLKSADSLNFKPGSAYQYSNPSYNGLALIIEQITNKPWQDFIINNVFKPSGMKNSKITNGSHPESGVAHAYINYYFKENKTGPYYEFDYGETPTFAASGNGGIWSSVLELAKYEDAIKENVFLSKALIKESRTALKTSQWSKNKPHHIGYGWFTGEESLFKGNSNFNVDFVYHTGSQGGFRAFYVSIPEKDILIVGLFNKPLSNSNKLLNNIVSTIEKNEWLD